MPQVSRTDCIQVLKHKLARAAQHVHDYENKLHEEAARETLWQLVIEVVEQVVNVTGVRQNLLTLWNSATKEELRPSFTEPIAHEEPYLPPTQWSAVLLMRGPYYYRPEWRGYTTLLHEAGRYDREVALRHAAKTPGVQVTELPPVGSKGIP